MKSKCNATAEEVELVKKDGIDGETLDQMDADMLMDMGFKKDRAEVIVKEF